MENKNTNITTNSIFNKKSIVVENLEQAMKFAEAIANSSFCPDTYKNRTTKRANVNDIAFAVLYGLEMGLTPFASLNNIAIIKGKPCLWGDGLKAVIYNTGLVKSLKEEVVGKLEDKSLKAVVKVSRKDQDIEIVAEFSIEDAEKAGLYPGIKDSYGNYGVWYKYPKRMLLNRARTYAFRDCFGDVLLGLYTDDEMVNDIKAKQEREIKPVEEIKETREEKERASNPNYDLMSDKEKELQNALVKENIDYEDLKQRIMNCESWEEILDLNKEFRCDNKTEEQAIELTTILKNKKEDFGINE